MAIELSEWRKRFRCSKLKVAFNWWSKWIQWVVNPLSQRCAHKNWKLICYDRMCPQLSKVGQVFLYRAFTSFIHPEIVFLFWSKWWRMNQTIALHLFSTLIQSILGRHLLLPLYFYIVISCRNRKFHNHWMNEHGSLPLKCGANAVVTCWSITRYNLKQ